MLLDGSSLRITLGVLMLACAPACAKAGAAEPAYESRYFEAAPQAARAEGPDDMAPPPGLIDFCRRRSELCRAEGQSRAAFEQTLSMAGQGYWRAVFSGRSRTAPGPAALGAHDSRRPTRRTVRAGDVLGLRPDVRIDLGGAEWAVVDEVNRATNRAIVQTPDRLQYGAEDYWNIPQSRNGERLRGDCEDFVLAKRAALIARGLPSDALSIAMVTTAWKESHAVLLISTDRGEYVLDNLDQRILPWAATSLTWRSRQRPGDILKWIDLGGI